jgi:hypothetical protein
VLTGSTAGPKAEAAINVPPGIYSVFVANGSSLPRPAMMTVLEGRQQRTAAVIVPTRGRVYVLGPNGPGRMIINTAQNRLVPLRLSSAQPALCLSLPNGQPRKTTAHGTATASGNIVLNQATTAARAEWSRLARGYNTPGQPDYADWNRGAEELLLQHPQRHPPATA